MKVLVTGSKGFIGSHLLKACENNFESWSSDIVTDYETERYMQISIENAGYHDIFNKEQFDVCINCSGAASVPASFELPLKDYELNVVNVYKILDAIRRFNPDCKFINLSSAAVYGNPGKLPVKEDVELKPLSPYGMHKKQSEEICSFFYKQWKIQTCSLRIFSAYGPGLTKQLFWDLYKKTAAGVEIELFGTGNETRDFIYIDDIVNIILLIIKSASFSGECINVANGRQWSVKELAALFINALQWQGNIYFSNTNRLGDPLYWQADINLIKSIGYKQMTSMEDGILNYIKWLKERK